MNSLVIDASALAAVFFQELHAQAVRTLLAEGRPLDAPDLILAEMANVIWKRWRRGEIDQAEARRMLDDVLRLPLRLVPSAELAGAALELALRTGRTAYDCLYLALAVRTRSAVLTADRRLVRALANTPLAEHVAWIGKGL